jgi:hypothetical protein
MQLQIVNGVKHKQQWGESRNVKNQTGVDSQNPNTVSSNTYVTEGRRESTPETRRPEKEDCSR